MFRNLLVPLDFTPSSLRAVDAAIELARGIGGRINLLHVIQTIPGLALDEERDFYERLVTAAEEQLAEHGRRLDEAQVHWHATVVFGSRVGEILRIAGEERVELIVLASHAVDPDGPPQGVAGTLSYQVATLATMPVLLVR